MSDKTGIEWTDSTWNPMRGCSLVSDGCKNCYAMGVAGRFGGPGQPYDGLTAKTTQGAKWNGKIMLVPDMLTQPIKWQRPRKIFVNSMSDLFHEGVPDSYIDQVFAVMALAPQHIFQVLTKRPQRMRDYFSAPDVWARIEVAARVIHRDRTGKQIAGKTLIGPLPHVWLGVSVEDQAAADERIPLLLQTPAAVRWISAEPLLGPVDLDRVYLSTDHALWVDWVVVGGESGPKARPMHPDWARSLRDQCAAANVPLLFKQWGEWLPISEISDTDYLYKSAPENDPEATRKCLVTSRPIGHDGGEHWEAPQGKCSYLTFKVGKKAAGRTLDGQMHDGYPEES